MNQVQRKFLIDRITSTIKTKIDILNKSKIPFPSASNYIFRAVLNNDLKLQSEDVIKYAIKDKALKAKEGENWLSGQRMGFEKERVITLQIQDLIQLPEDYKEELKRVTSENSKIEEDIKGLRIQLDTIEVRIQLASDKTLQRLITEVDDMGDISLIDTKMKLLN